jgi:hypothetical protein
MNVTVMALCWTCCLASIHSVDVGRTYGLRGVPPLTPSFPLLMVVIAIDSKSFQENHETISVNIFGKRVES